jgi:predicted ATPase
LPHSLPAERDRFIDRVATLAELAARFARGARLLSVLGTGGAGKTRLALRFGWTWLGDFAGGVWFCDLSAARDFDGIVHATAHGLRLELVGADPVRQIGDAIAGRGESLVIVDNFEQVAAHAETAIGRWLERAPAACFIVTTRERLGIVGEDTLQLPPLAVDDGAAMLRERAASAGAVPFTRHDEAAVPELVALLDGLPLAIELAASRIRVLPPAQLLPRMGERFSVLTGSRGRHDRQATLRATLDWSWGLLTEPERAALARLSVFENGFGLDAASAVVDLSAFFPASSVVETVQSLLDKSLLRNVGPDRFDLLRSVQDYAAERLTEAARAVTANAHAKHFLDWLGDLRPCHRAQRSRHLAAARRRLRELSGGVALGGCARACRGADAKHREPPAFLRPPRALRRVPRAAAHGHRGVAARRRSEVRAAALERSRPSRVPARSLPRRRGHCNASAGKLAKDARRRNAAAVLQGPRRLLHRARRARQRRAAPEARTQAVAGARATSAALPTCSTTWPWSRRRSATTTSRCACRCSRCSSTAGSAMSPERRCA